MRPTRRGMVLIGACLALYFVARRSLFGWFYMANAVAWALVLTNLIFPWWNLRRLGVTRRVHQTVPADVFEGDTVRVDLEVTNLTNPKFTPSFVFTAIQHCPLAPPDQAEKRFLVGMVPPRSSVTAHYAETCYRRGEFYFGTVLLEMSAPFGLFRARRRIKAASTVLVYPEVFPASGIDIFSNPVEGRSLASPARHVGEFRGSREYQIGDSLRSIHWRSSARQRQLMVKQYDKSPENQVTLAFDATKTFGEGKDTTLEYSIKLAASVSRDGRARLLPARHSFYHGARRTVARDLGLASHPELPGTTGVGRGRISRGLPCHRYESWTAPCDSAAGRPSSHRGDCASPR